MKRMEEHEVLHIGRTIAQWRTIAGCVQNTAKVQLDAKRQRELYQIALDIESHLPRLSSNDTDRK
jgi:hypothetical protein